MSTASRVLRGRETECATLVALLDEVRTGGSRVVTLTGEAGIGKTALLEYAGQRAAGFVVLRAVGVESEMELAFAALHQLCAPVLDRIGRLPVPQRDALQTAFGLIRSPPPERFLVGLALHTLLAQAANERPLLCVVDDAQWLDRASAQALAFVARRVGAEPIAMLIAQRDTVEPPDDFTRLQLGGIPAEAARALLDSAIAGPLDERVRERILAEARGNPLALLELPRWFTSADLGGGFGLRRRPHADRLPRAGRYGTNWNRFIADHGHPARCRLAADSSLSADGSHVFAKALAPSAILCPSLIFPLSVSARSPCGIRDMSIKSLFSSWQA